MSPRPYWKGYLKLALVSCPIALHAVCSSAERISFRQINRKTGNRLRQQLIDEETREVVEAHEKARGYEIGKGQYLLIEDEELEAIKIASTHIIDIDSFVPRAEIDQRFFDAPYYITPDDPVGQDAFAVIREAMRSKAVVALGRVVLSKRERVMALEPYDKGLIGTTLRYPYEVRHATDYFGEIPDLTPAPELLRLAAHILDGKTASSAPAGFRDRYEEALLAHLKAKQAGLPPQPQQSFAVPRAGPSISSRRCAGASRRTRNHRPPHARLPPSQRANGRECQNQPPPILGSPMPSGAVAIPTAIPCQGSKP
jgi:DNA end-binding protein Ku